MFIIYVIENTINLKKYVGQTSKDLELRWSRHKRASEYSKNMPIGAALRKHGKENFSIRELERVDSMEDANLREIYWANFYNSFSPNGYNLKAGGRLHAQTSEETKRRISESNKGKIVSEATRLKSSLSHLGNKLSEETKAKMSATNSGKKPHKNTVDAAREKCKKICIFISPDGEEVRVAGIGEFAKQIGMHPASISLLVRGKKEMIKGWKFKEEIGYNKESSRRMGIRKEFKEEI